MSVLKTSFSNWLHTIKHLTYYSEKKSVSKFSIESPIVVDFVDLNLNFAGLKFLKKFSATNATLCLTQSRLLRILTRSDPF